RDVARTGKVSWRHHVIPQPKPVKDEAAKQAHDQEVADRKVMESELGALHKSESHRHSMYLQAERHLTDPNKVDESGMPVKPSHVEVEAYLKDRLNLPPLPSTPWDQARRKILEAHDLPAWRAWKELYKLRDVDRRQLTAVENAAVERWWQKVKSHWPQGFAPVN